MPEVTTQQFATAHALAGAGGGMLAMALLYPLENVRTRLQVQVKRPSTPRSPRSAQLYQDWKKLAKKVPLFGATIECVLKVVHEEGWQGLYAGLQSSVIGVGISSFVYFYWYNFMKYVLYERRHKKIMPIDNVVIAAAAGVINVFSTAPFWLVTQRLTLQTKRKDKNSKVKYNGLIDAFQKIVKEEGPMALWDGLVPALALVTNPIIQFVCYEQFTRYVVAINKRTDPKCKLSAFQIFMLGAVAKAIATVATYPTQVLKSRLQVDPKGEHRVYDNLFHCASTMLSEEGPASFYSGMSAKLSQTVLNSAFTFLMYEKIFSLIVRAYVLSLRVKAKARSA